MSTRSVHVIPRFVGGGPERHVLTLAAENRLMGVDDQLTVVVLDPPVHPQMFLRARRANIDLTIRPEPADLRALVTQADVVHVHYWNHPALLALLRDEELPPARVVVWCHVLGLAAPNVLTREVGEFADRLVVTTELSRGADGALVAPRVDYIPGVADMSRLDGFQRRPHDGCCVGYIGLVNDTKMHPRFAAMTAAVSDPAVRFVVCGGGGGEDELRRRFEDLGAAGRVEIRGHVEDVRAALEGLDVFGYPLHPDTWATSEKALQEPMWVGIPPVVFPYGGVGRLVADGETGLVVDSEEGYAAAVERLAADEALRSRLGANAQRYARDAFDPRRWARVALSFVNDLLAEPKRARAPLPGSGRTAAEGFVAALGSAAGPFAASLSGGPGASAADREIASSSSVVAHGEGGIVHHRNAYPDDPHLRLWSGLVSAATGRSDVATLEYDAAGALGLDDGRPAAYAAAFR